MGSPAQSRVGQGRKPGGRPGGRPSVGRVEKGDPGTGPGARLGTESRGGAGAGWGLVQHRWRSFRSLVDSLHAVYGKVKGEQGLFVCFTGAFYLSSNEPLHLS